MLINADWCCCWLIVIDVDWCWLMLYYHVFFLSERTSRVSPAIFSFVDQEFFKGKYGWCGTTRSNGDNETVARPTVDTGWGYCSDQCRFRCSSCYSIQYTVYSMKIKKLDLLQRKSCLKLCRSTPIYEKYLCLFQWAGWMPLKCCMKILTTRWTLKNCSFLSVVRWPFYCQQHNWEEKDAATILQLLWGGKGYDIQKAEAAVEKLEAQSKDWWELAKKNGERAQILPGRKFVQNG